MQTLNLGILAHVDAGKTTLTERLLYAAGVIDQIGRVDDGTTQTDFLALERQRGITIKSAVVSFQWGSVTVNLIDTPGHPDFIAEVERVLNVLDGVVLVISAVEGVQSQTRILMRTLQRLRIPTLLFVNKIDRMGAHDERVLGAISEKLTPAVVPMVVPRDLGSRAASVAPLGPDDTGFVSRMAELLADHDDALLAAYVDDTTLPYERLRRGLRAQTRRACVHPVFFGSAATGAGVDVLMDAITELLPARTGRTDAPLSGSVFKVERGPAGEKVAFVRMFAGEVHVREPVRFGRDAREKVTAIRVFEDGSDVGRPSLPAGRIGKLWGLHEVQIGDVIGSSRKTSEHYFAPPTLETVVVPARSSEKAALHSALQQLAEQDPLIDLRQDDVRQELYVSLYGEVQKEVIQATLANDYRIEVGFRETTVICIERPVGMGEAVEVLRKRRNPFLATIGLRVEPALIGSGIEFRLDVKVGTIPLYVYKTVDDFRAAMERNVREVLRQGLYGWQVADCTVTMTESGYLSPGSTAGDFRKLTPLVVMKALKHAGTVVCEPIHRFHLEIPADTLAAVLPVLTRLGGVPQSPEVRGSSCIVRGDVPASRVHELQQQVRAPSRGEGVLECAFDHYRPVTGAIPTRSRTDNNPLNRKEYLLHVLRRV